MSYGGGTSARGGSGAGGGASGGAGNGRQSAPVRANDLKLENRRALSVSGVDDVESFDEHEIVMRCGGSLLVVGGEELSVGNLSVERGEVSVKGRIRSLVYEDATAGRGGFWSRLLRG